MGKRLFIVSAVVMVIAVSFLACRRSEHAAATSTPSGPSNSPSVVTVRAPGSDPAQGGTKDPAVDPPPSIPESGMVAGVESPAPDAAVATAAASVPAIQGQSAAPTTGKPVATLDLDWDLQPDSATPGRYTGVIGITNRSATTQVQVELSAAPGLTVLIGANGHAELAAQARFAHVVSVQLDPTAAADVVLLVTARQLGANPRARIVTIPLRATSAVEKPIAPASQAGGEEVLTGSDGQPVHFVPGSSGK